MTNHMKKQNKTAICKVHFISSSSYPVIPSGTQGVNKTSLSDPVPRQLFDFIPTLSFS